MRFGITSEDLRRQAFMRMATDDSILGPEETSTRAFLCYMDWKNECHYLGRLHHMDVQPGTFASYIEADDDELSDL